MQLNSDELEICSRGKQDIDIITVNGGEGTLCQAMSIDEQRAFHDYDPTVDTKAGQQKNQILLLEHEHTRYT